jgi:hypothetical protein
MQIFKKTSFRNRAVGDFFDTDFINVTEDMEKGVGIQLAAKYHFTAFPTLLVIDCNQAVLSFTRPIFRPMIW